MKRPTYGRLALQDGRWILSDVKPHVAIKLKQIFQRIPKTKTGSFELPDSEEVAADLDWLMVRYAFDIDDGDLAHLKRNRELFEIDKAESEAILLPDWVPGPVHGFKPGYKLHHHQAQARELVLKKKALLLGDVMGQGKSWTALGTLIGSPYLPAAIVVKTHLAQQWVDEFIKPYTYLSAHIIQGTKPYNLPPANIYLFKYSNIHGWVDLIDTGFFKAAIFDEAHELRNGTNTEKGKASKVLADNAQIKLLLSVSPDSIVPFVGGEFGAGWSGEIEDAWGIVEGTVDKSDFLTYEVLDVSSRNIMTRGWLDGGGWGWKRVKKIIRHAPGDKTIHKVRAGGRDLIATEDHSIFVAGCSGPIEVETGRINKGDILLSDNGANWDTSKEKPIDIAYLVADVPWCNAVVDLSGVNRRHLGLTAWQWQNFHKEAVYGPRLPIEIYEKNRCIVPPASLLYVGRGRGPSLKPYIYLSEWAYILGFYIGDGWVSSKQRVCFAVENDRVNDIVDRLTKLGIGLDPKIRVMRGASCEVRCSHRLWAEVLARVFNGAKCYEKRIPSEWIVTWPREARMNLLRGLIDSDGHISTGRRNYVAYTTTSKLLSDDILLLLNSLGIRGGCHVRKVADGGVVAGERIKGRRKSYYVYWSLNEMDGTAANNARKGNRHKFEWTRDISKESRVIANNIVPNDMDYVYDIEVDGHPSFSANGFLVHNTGTPIFNYGSEIFGIMKFVNPELLGSWDEFTREWCEMGPGQKWIVKDPQALGSYLRDSQVFLRRLREGRPVNKLVVEVDYENDVAEAAEDLAVKLALKTTTGTFVERGQAARELDALARQVTGMAKAKSVAAYVRMLLEAGRPVLLFGWHRSVYDAWMKELADFNPVMFTGSETPRQKEKAKEAFLSGKTDLCIMSLRSGEGTDGLQKRCSTVVFGELDWAGAVHSQGVGRVDRPGQQADVIDVIYLVANEGSDPVVMRVNAIKADQFQGIIDLGIGPSDQKSDMSRLQNLAKHYLEKRKAA